MTKVVKNIKTQPGVKYGGRTKGAPNKDTQTLQEKAKELGCDPFEILIHFAKGDYEKLGYKEYTYKQFGENVVEELTIRPELRQKAARDACEYLYPKRKAIEHTGKDGEKLFTIEDFIKNNGDKK